MNAKNEHDEYFRKEAETRCTMFGFLFLFVGNNSQSSNSFRKSIQHNPQKMLYWICWKTLTLIQTRKKRESF